MKGTKFTRKSLKHWINNAPANPKLLIWTPDLAVAGLKANEKTVSVTRQRPRSAAFTKELARRMSDGIFRVTHQGVAFADDGVVLDGQHRLHAVIESKQSVALWTFFGQDPENFAVLDGGRKRSSGDVFAMHGVAQAKRAASITRQVLVQMGGGIQAQGYKIKGAGTPEELYDKFIEIGPDDIMRGVNIASRLHKLGAPHKAVIGAFYVRVYQLAPEFAEPFFDSIITGANLGANSLEMKVRNYLTLDLDHNAKRKTRDQIVSDLTRAWNAKRSGRRTFKKNLIPIIPELA